MISLKEGSCFSISNLIRKRPIPLLALYQVDSPLGPAGSWLVERFKQELERFG